MNIFLLVFFCGNIIKLIKPEEVFQAVKELIPNRAAPIAPEN